MTVSNVLVLFGLGVLVAGIFIVFRPMVIVDSLKRFYRQYPLVHYAGDKQLTSRLFFVRMLGVVFILLGAVALYSSSGI